MNNRFVQLSSFLLMIVFLQVGLAEKSQSKIIESTPNSIAPNCPENQPSEASETKPCTKKPTYKPKIQTPSQFIVNCFNPEQKLNSDNINNIHDQDNSKPNSESNPKDPEKNGSGGGQITQCPECQKCPESDNKEPQKLNVELGGFKISFATYDTWAVIFALIVVLLSIFYVANKQNETPVENTIPWYKYTRGQFILIVITIICIIFFLAIKANNFSKIINDNIELKKQIKEDIKTNEFIMNTEKSFQSKLNESLAEKQKIIDKLNVSLAKKQQDIDDLKDEIQSIKEKGKQNNAQETSPLKNEKTQELSNTSEKSILEKSIVTLLISIILLLFFFSIFLYKKLLVDIIEKYEQKYKLEYLTKKLEDIEKKL